MKKTIAIILTAAILLCAAPLAGFMAFDWSDISFENVFSVPAKAVTIIDSGSCGVVDEDNGLDGSQVTWTLDSEGTVRISGEGEMADYSELGGLDLEAPSPFAFMAGITSLIIEEGVTSIGTGAFFGCFNLSSVTIPDGVCRIGTSAFFYCLSLPEVTIPENVESIGTRAFAYCPGLVNIFVAENNCYYASIDGVLFNKTVTELVQYPVGNSRSSYSVPAGVTRIGEVAFYYCNALQSVSISEGLNSIGNYAFTGCGELMSVTIPEGTVSIGDCAFQYCNKLEAVDLPVGLNSIGEAAFWECNSISSVIIPEGVTVIGKEAFLSCDWLSGVTVPSTVTEIGKGAFSSCVRLNHITVDSGNPCYASQDGVLFNKDKTCLMQYPSARNGASYTMPGSVTEIANWAFDSNRTLKSIVFSDHLETIGRESFLSCSMLESIELPDSVKNIQSSAFGYCDKLISVSIGSGVSQIGDGAFRGCAQLETISVDSENESFLSEDGILFNKDQTTLIQYPAGNPRTEYMIPASVTELCERAFENSTNLTTVVIPESITEITDSAFLGCVSLSEVTIPGSITYIGDDAFHSCSSLASVSFSDGLREIGDRAFAFCDALTTFSLPDSVTYIGKEAFSFCSDLDTLSIPDSVKTIDAMAFLGCGSLTSVIIPASVLDIGSMAFGFSIDEQETEYKKEDSFTIYCYPDSAGYRYAVLNGFDYVLSSETGIEMSSLPDRTLYGVGAKLKTGGLKLRVSYDNGTHCVVDSGFTVSGFDSSRAGICTVTVEYRGFTTSFDVEITDEVFVLKSGECGKDLTWTLTSDGTLTISGTGDMDDTIILQALGEYCDDVTSLNVQNGVTSIGEFAFYGYPITSAVLPESVATIGDSAFRYCKELTDVTIPEGVVTIGEEAFFGCRALIDVTIPASVTTIGENAFGFDYNHSAGESNPVDGFTVYGYSGSAAETYANENHFVFVSLGAPECQHADDDKDGVCDTCGYVIVATPDAPKNVQVKAVADHTLSVTYNASAGATQYNVYRYNGTKGEYVYKGTSFTTTYLDKTVVGGTTYYYKVVAVTKDAGLTLVSDMSVSANAKAVSKPAVPSGVAVKAVAENTLAVTCSASAGATQYNVYRYNGTKGEYVYKGTTYTTTYLDNSVVNGTTYYYKVVAVTKTGDLTLVSAKSASASAKALGTPGVPQNVTAVSNKAKTVTVSWSKVTGATQYNVYRYNGAKKEYVYVGTSYGTSFNVTGLTTGTTYYFKVLAACKGDGLTFVGAKSASASAKVK